MIGFVQLSLDMMVKKLALGAAQWGMHYGVSNCAGKTTPAEVKRILSYARDHNLTFIDTASNYGNSEETLGLQDLSGFNIVTKLPGVDRTHDGGSLIEWLTEAFQRSLTRLNKKRVYGLLVHKADDLLDPCGQDIIQLLYKFKSLGHVEKIGVSVYSPDQLIKIVQRFIPDIVQFPANVFDQRFLNEPILQHLKSLGTELHVRSVFLQGLLLMDPKTLDTYFKEWVGYLDEWHTYCAKLGCSPLAASLRFVTGNRLVDQVVVGFENHLQLAECCEGIEADQDIDAAGFALTEEKLINPSLWRLKVNES